MKNTTNSARSGEAREGFTFNPSDLEITGLFATALTGEKGYESARIFSNGVMKCKLILRYAYRFNTEDFPNQSEEEILNTIKAQTEPYLQSKNNLEIFELAYGWMNITDQGKKWVMSYSDNGKYLHDLENASYEEGQSSKIVQPNTHWIQEGGEEPKTTSTAILSIAFFVSPPPGKQMTYNLGARHTFTDEGETEQTQVTNTISLKAEVFSVNKDDLEFKQVGYDFYHLEEQTRNNCVLFALSYKGERFGSARLNNITRYSGIILDEERSNVCLIHAKYTGVSGIFYYPSTQPKNHLFAGTDGEAFQEAKALNCTWDVKGSGGLVCNGYRWDWIKGFSEDEVLAAHELGIPVVASYEHTPYVGMHEMKPLSGYEIGDLEAGEFFVLEDNCGNQVKLMFHGVMDIDGFRFPIMEVCEDPIDKNDANDKRTRGPFSKWNDMYDQGGDMVMIKRAGIYNK